METSDTSPQNTVATSEVLAAGAGVRKGWPPHVAGWLLILMTVVAYLPVFRAGYIWDDDRYLTETQAHLITPAAPEESAISCLRRIWATTGAPQYYPLVFTSFWIEYTFWGFDHPAGYHATNLLLHAITALLVWRILLRLKIPGAWLAAAIFAIHPINVETVAWITERKNTLSGLFYMIALLCYVKYCDREGWWFYLIALATFVLALLSKTVTCSLPLVILLVFWLKRRLRWTTVAAMVPFLAIGYVMGKFTAWYEFHAVEPAYNAPMPITTAFSQAWHEGAFTLTGIQRSAVHRLEREKSASASVATRPATQVATAPATRPAVGVSAEPPAVDRKPNRSGYDLSAGQRAIIASRALLHYTKKLIVPYPLAFFYHRWDEKKELNTDEMLNFWPVAVVAGIGIVTIALSVLYGRGIFVAAAFFVLTLFPALGFFDVWPMRYSFVADHFQYLADIGPIVLFAAGMAMAFDRIGGRPRRIFNGATAPGGILAIVLLAALGAGTFGRSRVFRNEETLYLDTIAKTPDSWIARNNLGTYYVKLASEAKNESQKTRYYAMAADQFETIIERRPDFVDAYGNLGNVLVMLGRYPRAEEVFRRAIEKQPSWPDLYVRLGKVLIFQDKTAEALRLYEQAANTIPDSARIYSDWAQLLERLGQTEQAAQKRSRAEELRKEAEKGRPKPPPSQAPAGKPPAPIDLGNATTERERRAAYMNLFDQAVARRDYARAMEIVLAGRNEYPTSTGLLKRYGLLIAAAGDPAMRDPKQAVEFAEMLHGALERSGLVDIEMMEVLAASYAAVGRYEDAVKAARKGLEMPAQSPRLATVKARLRSQLETYQANKPYLMPAPGPATATATRPVPTRPAVPVTRPATVRPTPSPATRPAALPAAAPAQPPPSPRVIRATTQPIAIPPDRPVVRFSLTPAPTTQPAR